MVTEIKLIKEFTVEQNLVSIFMAYGMYKEAIELIIKNQPKRIEMKEK